MPLFNSKVVVTESADACATWVQQHLIEDINAAIGACGRCIVVLAGGSTPKLLYQKLAALPVGEIAWDKVILLWGDERNVPPDHNDSNYKMAQLAMLDALASGPQPTVFRIPVGELSPTQAALAYEKTLSELNDGIEGFLSLDIVLLGIGDDAHTASLFPETEALQIADRAAAENYIPKMDTWRVTLTYPQLNTAKTTYFLVCGAGKKQALQQIWGEPKNIELYPAQGINSSNGQIIWVVDSAAVKGLEAVMPPVFTE